MLGVTYLVNIEVCGIYLLYTHIFITLLLPLLLLLLHHFCLRRQRRRTLLATAWRIQRTFTLWHCAITVKFNNNILILLLNLDFNYLKRNIN